MISSFVINMSGMWLQVFSDIMTTYCMWPTFFHVIECRVFHWKCTSAYDLILTKICPIMTFPVVAEWVGQLYGLWPCSTQIISPNYIEPFHVPCSCKNELNRTGQVKPRSMIKHNHTYNGPFLREVIMLQICP